MSIPRLSKTASHFELDANYRIPSASLIMTTEVGAAVLSTTWPDPNYVATIDEISDAITNANVVWAENRTEITYDLTGLDGASYREKITVGAFNAWSDVIDINFREVSYGESPDITFDITNRFFSPPPKHL